MGRSSRPFDVTQLNLHLPKLCHSSGVPSYLWGYICLLVGKQAGKKREFIFCLFQCAKLHQYQPRKSLGKLFSHWRCFSTFEREKLLSGYLSEAYFDGFSLPKPAKILFCLFSPIACIISWKFQFVSKDWQIIWDTVWLNAASSDVIWAAQI